MECKECKRLKEGIYSVVAALVSNNKAAALRLARAVMYGGSVNNAIDLDNPKRHCEGKYHKP